jgi:fatty acid desaturase
LVLGLSAGWWKKKHLAHHIFTNNEGLDPDIQHSYRTILFPLMLLKWRVESIYFALRHCQTVQK